MQSKAYQKDVFWYFRIIFFLSILSLAPALTYAQTGITLHDDSNGAFFTPAPHDQSIIYLGELFGNVPPILAGTGSELMAGLFKLFNTAVLTLGIILAGYTTFVGVLNTAGEGEMLGKAWSSIWIPIRTVAGVSLLIPTASGYCVCQTFMMWLLVQGIGAADTLTGSIVDYMESGQKIFVSGDTAKPIDQGTTGGNQTQYDPTIITIYQGLSCMQALQKAFPDVNPGYITPPTDPDKTGIYKFSANYADPSAPTTAIPISCGQTAKIETDNANAFGFIEQGIAAIMPSLNSAAYFMVNDTSTDQNTVMHDTFDFVGSDFLAEVEKTYNSYIIQASNANTNSTTNDYYEDIRSYGWATLGDIYWDMAQSEGTSKGDVNETALLSWDTSMLPNISSTDSQANYEAINDNIWKYGHIWATDFVNDLITSRNDANSSNSGSFKQASKEPTVIASSAMAAIAMGTLYSMEAAFSSSGNPMVKAQKLGHTIILAVELVFASLTVALIAGTLIAGEMSSISSGFLLYQTALAMLLPGLMLFLGLMLTLGGTMAVVIPFIPALAYFLAVVAWMIAALETIVAAPIVAIGVLHPDGQHQVWGKAEPAIMLMINMFLRPSLIVIGMAAGIILSFITVQFINFGFLQVMYKIIHGAPTTIEAVLFLMTYMAIILACVNKSFSVIDALPDTVMRWIQGGEGTKFGGGQEAMQKIQGAQESGAQKHGEGGAQAGSDQAGGAQKLKDNNDDRKDKAKNRTTPPTSTSGGNASH